MYTCSGINAERVDEGNKQLDILLKEFEDKLTDLGRQKDEEETKVCQRVNEIQ